MRVWLVPISITTKTDNDVKTQEASNTGSATMEDLRALNTMSITNASAELLADEAPDIKVKQEPASPVNIEQQETDEMKEFLQNATKEYRRLR